MERNHEYKVKKELEREGEQETAVIKVGNRENWGYFNWGGIAEYYTGEREER